MDWFPIDTFLGEGAIKVMGISLIVKYRKKEAYLWRKVSMTQYVCLT